MTTGTDRGRLAGALAAVTWLAVTAALQWSVVRFRVLIVLVLTAAAVLLAGSLGRRVAPDPAGRWVPFALMGSAAVTAGVPLFSYLRGGWLTAAVALVMSLALVLAAGVSLALVLPREGRGARWATATHVAAVIGAVALGCVVILGDRAPRIDVWVMLQQSSALLGRGENFYDATWTGSPGVQDLYSYLPWTTVLLAPGRWLLGDVRWALLAWGVVLLVATGALARAFDSAARGRRRGAAVAALLVVVPGTITQVDQAWTEPLLAALLVLWALLVAREHAWWAVLPLALACASKQHLVLVVPLLMVWRPFGWRRVLAAGGLTAALIAPWVLADPAAFWHDTVTALVGFHPIRFANTWYLLLLNELGVALPFWVTGLVVAGGVGVATWVVWRRQPGLGELLRWMALVLLVANLVNKQAFYNQFWLSLALVAVSLVAVGPSATTSVTRLRPGREGAPASR